VKLNGTGTAKMTISRINPQPGALSKSYYGALLRALLTDASDIFAHWYSNADVARDINTVNNRLDAEGLGFVTKTLPTLISGLLTLLESGDASFPQFKIKRGTEHPAFLGRLFHLVLSSATKPDIRRKAFDCIYTISVSFKKLKGEYPKSVLRKQFKDFVEVDEALLNLDWFSEERLPIMNVARAIVHDMFRDFTLSDAKAFLPQPGPGATNTPTKKHARYQPSVVYRQIDRVMPVYEWWYPHPWDACLSAGHLQRIYKNAVNEPCARFKFVPKTNGKARGICIEENEMQVMQQAVRKAMYSLFDRSYRPFISLTDQSINANLALESSSSGEMSTIDMSDASDRVARELVSWLFQDNRELHDVLMALSTKWIMPPKELRDDYPCVLRTAKYAPMGSALCFPVMTVVHRSLIQAIIWLSDAEAEKRFSNPSNVPVYVYGDDIIVESNHAEFVMTQLPLFGMKINKSKSFYRSGFRESCGIHAYQGTDVTPVYAKYTPHHNTDKAIASLFGNEADYNSKKFFKAAELVRSFMQNRFTFVPADLSIAGYSRLLDDGKFAAFKRDHRLGWSKDLQCRTYLLPKLEQPIERQVISDDQEAYLRWLWVHAKNEGKVGKPFNLCSIGDSFNDIKIVKRRVFESALSSPLSGVSKVIDRSVTIGSRMSPLLRNFAPQIIVLRSATRLQTPNEYNCVWV